MKNEIRRAIAAAACIVATAPALSSPADSVIAPDIEAGEREIELAFGAD